MSLSRLIPWFVWGIASIFYAYQYILRVMPGIMLTDIMDQFKINTAVYGQFSGIYYMGYSLMHLPIGIMLDRFGPRKVMSGCMLLTVIGLLPLLFSTSFIFPIIGRGLIGIGSSAAILGVFQIVRITFCENRFSRMLSVSVTIGLIGAIYGGGPVKHMCESLGYQSVIQIFAVIGLGLAILTFIIVPEIEKKHSASVLNDIKDAFSNKKVMIICLCAGAMVGPLEGFADVWAPAFLKQVYGFDESSASYLPSLIFIGMCVGGPLLSLIAEKTNYMQVIIGSGLVMAMFFIAFILYKFSVSAINISFVLIGICCAYQILAIYQASTYVREEVKGLTTAIANMIIMIFGYALHTCIGIVIDSYGGTKAPLALIYGMGVIPVALGIGVIGFVILSRQGKKAYTA